MAELKLLDRDNFREGVFKRDNHKCVICGNPAQDAHHIVERRLFDDGGYYLENGASLCGDCHMKAEQTLLSVEDIRKAAGITKKVMPPQFYDDEHIDKWGNPILSNGRRAAGELFYDESVQKVLAPVLELFTPYVKYPRTPHLPWSGGVSKGDKKLTKLDHFIGKEVIVTAKLDGENTTMYHDYIHARSLDSRTNATRHWVINLHSQIKFDIPEGWRINGENLWAKHTIAYKNLESYFYIFAIWNEKNICLSWDETTEWAQLLNLKTAPLLYRGIFDEKAIQKSFSNTLNGDDAEGYVVRVAERYGFSQFVHSVAKYVTPEFKQSMSDRHKPLSERNEIKHA